MYAKPGTPCNDYNGLVYFTPTPSIRSCTSISFRRSLSFRPIPGPSRCVTRSVPQYLLFLKVEVKVINSRQGLIPTKKIVCEINLGRYRCASRNFEMKRSRYAKIVASKIVASGKAYSPLYYSTGVSVSIGIT